MEPQEPTSDTQKTIDDLTKRRDALTESLSSLGVAHANLQAKYDLQCERYHKVLREMQFYKQKYERQLKRGSAHSHTTDTTTRSSAHSAISNGSSILADNEIDLLAILDTGESNNGYYYEDNNTSSYALLSPPPAPPMPMGPPPSTPAEAEEEEKEAKKAATGELVFACGEGFWDTIARGKNNRPEVEALVSNYLKRGGKPNVAKNFASLKSVKEGYGLLHALIVVKNTAAVTQVLAAGANPNAYPLSEASHKLPPLVLAAKVNHLSSVRLLLDYHADPLQRGPNQQTALHEAATHDAHDIAVLLLRSSKYALLDCVDTHGATALHYACAEGKTRLVSYFIRECHVSPNVTDAKGETALHYAVRHRRSKAVARLLECGAYVNPYVSRSVHTPLEVAKSGNMKPIMELLKAAGGKTTKEMEKLKNKRPLITSFGSNTRSANSAASSALASSGVSSNSTVDTQSIHSSSSGASSGKSFLSSRAALNLRGSFLSSSSSATSS